jgi:DUF4097 and DUF4098 domain-containing protein YvlB
MSHETIEKTFKVDTPAILTLSNIRGSVEIVPGEDNILYIKAVKHINSGDEDRTKITITQVDSTHVSVKTKFQNGWKKFPSHKPCEVDYIVRVPKACSLKISSVSNTTAIQDVDGEMTIHTVSGTIKLKDICGSISIDTVSGRVSGNRVVGPLTLNTVSGNICLHESHFPRIDGHTVSGKVSIQSSIVEGPYYFKSVSGDVEFIVPLDSTISANLKSISGRIKTPLTITSSHINGGNSNLEIQGGGVEVQGKSVSGNLYIKPSKEMNNEVMKNSSVQNTDEHSTLSANKPPSTGDNTEILDRIAAGELSVDEAIEQILE